MSIAVVCPQCCQSYQVDGSLAGTAVQCRCGARFGIPAAEPVRQMAAATREPLAVTCPHCLARFSAPPHLLGQAASCPSCALTFCVTPEATTDAWQPALNSGTCGAGGAAPL
ncbi:MAG: hypothetical protein KDA47_21160, partial [Planctomycetales bacterium]|nr:hypothetical protein [Planctomycetales bacterium]